MAAEKRPAGEDFGDSQLIVKRANLGESNALTRKNVPTTGALVQSIPSASGLHAPLMELTGHSGEVFCARFDPAGNYIASGSMDRKISQ